MHSKMHLINSLWVAIIFCTLLIHTKAQCQLNEFYYDSTYSPACDSNCQDLQRRCPFTLQHAQAGCYCQPSFARNLRQQCISRSACSRDCFPNESPIAPMPRACERLCRSSPNTLAINICYKSIERRCVCALHYCRNRNGQCQRGS